MSIVLGWMVNRVEQKELKTIFHVIRKLIDYHFYAAFHELTKSLFNRCDVSGLPCEPRFDVRCCCCCCCTVQTKTKQTFTYIPSRTSIIWFGFCFVRHFVTHWIWACPQIDLFWMIRRVQSQKTFMRSKFAEIEMVIRSIFLNGNHKKSFSSVPELNVRSFNKNPSMYTSYPSVLWPKLFKSN